MKTIHIIGNWKSHKTSDEAREWFGEIAKIEEVKHLPEDKKVVLCPPFHLIPLVSALIQEYQLPFSLGAQNVSAYGTGAHTGEIAAEQLKEYASYVLIGHSERRQMGETDELVNEKAQKALQSGLIPVVCVQGKETPVPTGVTCIAYEPIFAIGTGNADTPEDAEDVLRFFKEKGMTTCIYGGSVNPNNVASFTSQPSVDGVLPGTDSLDPIKFAAIITEAHA